MVSTCGSELAGQCQVHTVGIERGCHHVRLLHSVGVLNAGRQFEQLPVPLGERHRRIDPIVLARLGYRWIEPIEIAPGVDRFTINCDAPGDLTIEAKADMSGLIGQMVRRRILLLDTAEDTQE